LSGEYTFDKVHAVSQAICFKKAASYLTKANTNQTVGKHLELLFRVSSLGLQVQSFVEQFDKA